MISKIVSKLRDPEYRKAFVASQIYIGIPFQIRALQKARGWTQQELAERTGMLQPRISAIQTPGKVRPNIETLRRIADAFGCGLIVRFVPFSELALWSERFNPETFDVPSYEKVPSYEYEKVVPSYEKVLVVGSKALAVRRTIESLYALLDLPENWDSYGAQPIRRDVIDYAAKCIPSLLQSGTPEPAVVPTARGTVQLEWHRKGVDVEIYIDSHETVRFFAEDLTTGKSVEKPLAGNDQVLASWVARVSD